jgi:hypothetical protein
MKPILFLLSVSPEKKNVTGPAARGMTLMTSDHLTLTKRDSLRLSRHQMALDLHDHAVRGRKMIKALHSYS